MEGIKYKNVIASFGPQFVYFNGHWKHKNGLNLIQNDNR
jgi:hypothetical protein